ncbi:MAG TPA: hypothetical protein VHS09_05465 [Polyangiaceae bacterium]|jgi:hypothetical protein|nr:hypothetical protein [Polyangiaceae bacterium]
MPDDAAEKKDAADFDVVMPHGKTADGAGTQVLRARPGRIEAGEVRPMKEGKPLGAGEVVSLKQRADAPALYDVKVEHVVEGSASKAAHAGPAQVATPEYRASWDRVFGAGAHELN